MKLRSIIYVDGFNLYYGALKGGPHKWLSLGRYFALLRPDDDIQVIRYFSAPVNGTSTDQETYLRALTTDPLVEVILGKFKRKNVRCRVASCAHAGDRMFKTVEEKRTDVNIAVSMLDDAYQDLADRFILISGDSDLVPAVARIKQRFSTKQIIVYVPSRDPTRGAAVEIRSAADSHKTLPLQLLPRAQFPATLTDGTGQPIHRPSDW